MKMASFVAGLVATGLFVFAVECRAAPQAGFQGGGFRGGFGGRRFGPAVECRAVPQTGFQGGGFRGAIAARTFGSAFGGARFGRMAPREFTENRNGPAFAAPHCNRFYARDHRFFSHRNGYPLPTAFAFSAFGIPWAYPYAYDDATLYEDPTYGVAVVNNNPEVNGLAGAAQPAMAQPPSYYGPVGGGIRAGSDRPYQGPVGGGIRTGSDRSLGNDGSPSRPTSAAPPQYFTPDQPASPQADRAMPVASPIARAQPGPFGQFVLLTWRQDAGKATVLVENTETNALEEITSQANKDNLRIVTIHPSLNPKLSEVVLSNGMEQGTVKFRFEGIQR